MKNWIKELILTVSVLCFCCELVLGMDSFELFAESDIESVSVSQTVITLEIGSTYTLKTSVFPAEMDTGVSWKSSDESVVTVAKGVITAVAKGTADVTATANADTSKTAVCKVTVVGRGEGTQPTKITLSENILDLGFGKTALLSVNVSPDDAVMPVLTWSSSDDTVVKVADGQVTGIEVGTATVTVSVGALSASCNVTVTRKGIEGDWQTSWSRYVITEDTIIVYYKEHGPESVWYPSIQYNYSKTGNETNGIVTVTARSFWNNSDGEWQAVDMYFDKMHEEQIDLIDTFFNKTLRECILCLSGKSDDNMEMGLETFIYMMKTTANEIDSPFDESVLAVENLDKPIPSWVKDLCRTYTEKIFAVQRDERKNSSTYEYSVFDCGNHVIIQFRGVYDIAKKWFEQRNGSFYGCSSNNERTSYYPDDKMLIIWDSKRETRIYFSSVTETSLIDRNSGETWTALWNDSDLIFTNPNGDSYIMKLWVGSDLY